MRELTYAQALNEALVQAMDADSKVFVIGLEVDGERGIFGTTRAAALKYPNRVFDSPLSEAGITGWGTGAALAGMRPVMVHARVDFLLLAMDQIANHAAKWRYMSGGAYRVPWVIRTIIGRGKGQGAQHAQALHALFAHIPGLKVVMPSNAYDAKGLLAASIKDNDPVVFIEHRWLFDHKEIVPEEPYELPLGQAKIVCSGTKATIIAVSYMVYEAKIAASFLAREGIDVEIVDLRTVQPLDKETIIKSAIKTGRVVIADVGGKEFGISAEISALINEEAFGALLSPVLRIGLPHESIPCAAHLEKAYYPGARDIVLAVYKTMGRADISVDIPEELEEKFKGPF